MQRVPELPLGGSRVLRGRRKCSGEEGYILIAVLFLMVMVLIALSIAAPKMAADIERNREVELMHRGKQYQRAIKMYFKKFGAYPPNMDALEKTQQIRFLRKRYKDPMTGKDEWHLIHFGENKTPTAFGFFGQPLGGVGGAQTLAGTGPGGVGQNIGNPIGGSSFGGSTGGGAFGSSSMGGSSFGGSSLGNSPTGGGLTSGSTIGSTGTDPNAGSTSGATGTTTGATVGGAGVGNSNGSDGTASNNQTFGGGGIIGVESTSPKLAILEYKKKKHFNEWEFVYDPQSEQTVLSNNTNIGQPAGGIGNGSSGGINSPSMTNQPPINGIGPSSGSPGPTQQQPQPQQPNNPQQ